MCQFTPPAYLTLAPRPESVGMARRFLQDRGCPQHHAQVVDTAALLVSELVTNAVRHGQPPITVEIACDESHALQVRVSDASPELPNLVVADPDDDHGRGLAITEILSSAWGVDPLPGGNGKAVWFRVHQDPSIRGD